RRRPLRLRRRRHRLRPGPARPRTPAGRSRGAVHRTARGRRRGDPVSGWQLRRRLVRVRINVRAGPPAGGDGAGARLRARRPDRPNNVGPGFDPGDVPRDGRRPDWRRSVSARTAVERGPSVQQGKVTAPARSIPGASSFLRTSRGTLTLALLLLVQFLDFLDV